MVEPLGVDRARCAGERKGDTRASVVLVQYGDLLGELRVSVEDGGVSFVRNSRTVIYGTDGTLPPAEVES